MGFFDNLFGRGKAYSANRRPRLACELTMDGNKYLLEEFDLDFEGSGEKRYIPLYAIFSDKLTPELESWINRSDIRKDGTVKFYRNNENIDEGARFTLTFYDAVCVRYQKETRGDCPVTMLVLAVQKIKLSDQES